MANILPVKVYPNPTTGIAYITYTTTDASERVQLDVYDLYGKLVRNVCNATQASGEHTHVLDASALSNGLYYIRLQNGNKLGYAKLSLLKQTATISNRICNTKNGTRTLYMNSVF